MYLLQAENVFKPKWISFGVQCSLFTSSVCIQLGVTFALTVLLFRIYLLFHKSLTWVLPSKKILWILLQSKKMLINSSSAAIRPSTFCLDFYLSIFLYKHPPCELLWSFSFFFFFLKHWNAAWSSCSASKYQIKWAFYESQFNFCLGRKMRQQPSKLDPT